MHVASAILRFLIL